MSVQRVLLLSRFFPPENSSAASRVGAMAEALSKEHDVSVVTPKPREGFPPDATTAGRTLSRRMRRAEWE